MFVPSIPYMGDVLFIVNGSGNATPILPLAAFLSDDLHWNALPDQMLQQVMLSWIGNANGLLRQLSPAYPCGAPLGSPKRAGESVMTGGLPRAWRH